MRKIVSFVLILCMFLSLAPAAFADSIVEEEIPSGTVEPCGDETAWYYTQYDGVLYKRLWSYTQAKWLTDWIPA